MKETMIMRESLLLEAISRELLTRTEYEERYMGRYADHEDSSDAFFDYLTAVLCFGDLVFRTHNDRLRADGDHLLDKFGVVIL